MTKPRPIRCTDEVFKKFQDICDGEGRSQGKMLEILVSERESIETILTRAEKISKELLKSKEEK